MKRFKQNGLRWVIVACVVVISFFWLGRLCGEKNVWYVDSSQPDDSGAGTSWAFAKQTIQAALDASRSGDTILVTNGIYRAIRTNGKDIEIASVNGAQSTIIDGGLTNRCATLAGSLSTAFQSRLFERLYVPWYFYLPSMVPAMGMQEKTPSCFLKPSRRGVLKGFTLRNGYASLGAGAYGGTLIDCVMDWNVAEFAGGGVWGSTLEHCVLKFNRSNWLGGGSWGGSLTNCVVESNVAPFGGGSWGGQLQNCRIVRNQGECGGGAAASRLGACELVSNVGWKIGSAAYGGWLERCVLIGNTMKNPNTTNVVAYGSSLHACEVVETLDAASAGQEASQTWCVDAQRSDDSGDGQTWQTAKRSIQAAVEVSAEGDVVIVTNGVYGAVISDNRVVTIQSVNGSAVTTIDGRGRFRCATLGMDVLGLGQKNTVLRGFTLFNGAKPVSGGTGEQCVVVPDSRVVKKRHRQN